LGVGLLGGVATSAAMITNAPVSTKFASGSAIWMRSISLGGTAPFTPPITRTLATLG
jgi:hypothetical protein